MKKTQRAALDQQHVEVLTTKLVYLRKCQIGIVLWVQPAVHMLHVFQEGYECNLKQH